MITTIGENGEMLDYYEEKNKEIRAKLQPVLDELVEQKKADIKGQQKFGYRFAVNLDAVLRSYGLMSAEQFARFDYDEIEASWFGFLNLIAEINTSFELIANKQLYCSYARLNIRQYSQLEKSQDEDIKNLMISLNDFFVGMGFTATESGNASASAIKQRLGAKFVGHDVVSASEELLANAVAGEVRTPQEIMSDIERIAGENTQKKLTGKQKSKTL